MSGDSLRRWRLILGEAGHLGARLHPDDLARDAALAWLYDRGSDLADRDMAGRAGGHGPSVLDVPEWISQVHRLFPKETIERLERDAVERYGIDELVTNEEVLRRVQPSSVLLEAVLRTKHLMSPRVRVLARDLVARVVRDLQEKLAREVRLAFAGARKRRRSRTASASLLDARATIRTNLRHWDAASGRLVIERPIFMSRSRRDSLPWQVIILVDQSGSMASSVIHSAVMASCLWSVPGLKTRLVAFDTEVVDLTSSVEDPVELLMRVQLGGGTDIGRAVRYASQLVESPKRTVLVIVSDFMEGAEERLLVGRVKALVAEGVHVLGLAALDEKAEPRYDHGLARQLVAAGAEVAALTPANLAHWLAQAMSR